MPLICVVLSAPSWAVDSAPTINRSVRKASGTSSSNSSTEHGVLTGALDDASPAGVASDVDHRRERPVDADGACLARGDGLRIFAGACAAGDAGATPRVAAPWVPDAPLCLADGKVRPEFMWAALDCPGYFAARSDGVPMLLASFTAHVDRRVHVDESCVVVGWRIRSDGRKHEVGTALFDDDGVLCAQAHALWIEPRKA